MFAVLAEDDSDANTVAVFVKRLSGASRSKVLKCGFGGVWRTPPKSGEFYEAARVSGRVSLYPLP
jgi:hypothetical protein